MTFQKIEEINNCRSFKNFKWSKISYFELAESVVMIDDPICSMDDGALFHAFGFIKARTQEAKQLFILTHNFMFFRQVRYWFNALSKKRGKEVLRGKISYYQTVCYKNQGERESKLIEMDCLLKNYQSEYHYLFSLVYNCGNEKKPESLADYYHMPNIARRVLEYFLAFKNPTPNATFYKSLIETNKEFDFAKKNKIERFVNVYSHNQIGNPEHNPVILSETPTIMKHTLEFIQRTDKDHYGGMMECVADKDKSCK